MVHIKISVKLLYIHSSSVILVIIILGIPLSCIEKQCILLFTPLNYQTLFNHRVNKR